MSDELYPKDEGLSTDEKMLIFGHKNKNVTHFGISEKDVEIVYEA